MDKRNEQLLDLLSQLIESYESRSILEDEDEMIVWKVKMEWLIKQLTDIKFTALYKYTCINKVLI